MLIKLGGIWSDLLISQPITEVLITWSQQRELNSV